jgi:hypothetical protein
MNSEMLQEAREQPSKAMASNIWTDAGMQIDVNDSQSSNAPDEM